MWSVESKVLLSVAEHKSGEALRMYRQHATLGPKGPRPPPQDKIITRIFKQIYCILITKRHII